MQNPLTWSALQGRNFMFTASRMLVTAIVVTCFLIAGPVLARTSDELKALQQEVQTLQQGQVDIQKDLEEIKKLLHNIGTLELLAEQEVDADEPVRLKHDLPWVKESVYLITATVQEGEV
jgi:hypothetical protein